MESARERGAHSTSRRRGVLQQRCAALRSVKPHGLAATFGGGARQDGGPDGREGNAQKHGPIKPRLRMANSLENFWGAEKGKKREAGSGLTCAATFPLTQTIAAPSARRENGEQPSV